MSTMVPEIWKTDNLLLLVGGNPLPNYVAAKLLLKPGGTLHLLYTAATGEIASAIAATANVKAKRHEIANPANKSTVAESVAGALECCCQGQTVGLHYTGGTKSMAVHAYTEVRRRCPGAVLTYLDSRNLALYCDAYPGTIGVQFSVKPTIVDLVRLHGLTLVNEEKHVKDNKPVRPEPVLPQLNAALAKAHATKEGASAYDKWCKQFLRQKERKDELVKKLGQFPRNPVPLPTDSSLAEVVTQIQIAFGLEADAFCPEAVLERHIPDIDSTKKLVKYLDGGWMELHVADAFLQNSDKHELHSISISLDVDKKQSPYDFEFDVAALQGYQLYAVSCTRSAETRICKSKLFEAMARAEQLGGSEAKTALVCAYQNPEELEKEVQERWRPEMNSRLRVFGAKHLADLHSEFDIWLRQA